MKLETSSGQKLSPFNWRPILIALLWTVWVVRSSYWLWVELSAPLMTAKRVILGAGFVFLTLLGGVALYVLFRWICKPNVLLGIILCGAFLIRWGYVTVVPTQPKSDFLLYHTMALQFRQGDYHESYARPMGYPLLLSLFYRWRPDPSTGRWLNVILSTLSVGIVYLMGKQILDASFGLAAAYLTALFPAEIIMTSVLASEIPASLCFLIALWGLLNKRSYSRNTVHILVMGISLGLSIIFRTAFLIYLPVFLFLLGWLLYCQGEKPWRKLFFLIMSFLGTLLVFLAVCARLIGTFSLKPLSSEVSYFPFLAGTNAIVGTSFRQDSKMYANWPEEERAYRAVTTALERIRLHPAKALQVAARKIDLMFGSDEYAPMWSFYTVKTRWNKTQNTTLRLSLRVWTQLMKVLMLILGGIGVIYLWRVNPGGLGIILVIILMTLLPHVILEAQGRYRHQLNGVMTILAAGGVRCFWNWACIRWRSGWVKIS
ncbi:MAG: glycosyltransferase family 39 protein [Chloroflexota bacterium]